MEYSVIHSEMIVGRLTSLDFVIDAPCDVAAGVVPMIDIIDGQSPAIVSSFEDVIHVLGGVKRVAALTRCCRSSVWNWRQAKRFPPAHYRVVQDALAKQHMRADMRLFSFTRSRRKPDPVIVVDVALA